MSSFKYYRLFKHDTFVSEYVNNINDFKGVNLKFRARSCTLPLGENVCKFNDDGSSKCPMCSHPNESLTHFMLSCPILSDLRAKCFHLIYVSFFHKARLSAYTTLTWHTQVHQLFH